MKPGTRSFIASVLFSMLVLGSGCAGSYQPTSQVTDSSQLMSEEQADDTLRRFMQPRRKDGASTDHFVTGIVGLGLCEAYEFSLDARKGADITVTKDELSLNALKRGKLVKRSTQGLITSATGMRTTLYYEQIPYREHLRFDKIAQITISEPSILNTSCGRQEGQSEVFIRESMTRWYALLIPTSEKEQFIAAWLRLRPGIDIEVK